MNANIPSVLQGGALALLLATAIPVPCHAADTPAPEHSAREAAPQPVRPHAVRAGRHVQVSGASARLPGGRIAAPGDAAEQTRLALSAAREALARAGAGMDDVVRTRLYVTDAGRFADYARGHSEFFADIRPASLLVEVPTLPLQGQMVAIDIEAIVDDAAHPRELVSSGTRWEPWFGYSRAVKVGDTIHVSGTTSWNARGEIVGDGDYYLQTRQSLANIADWLAKAGAGMGDVVRTRVYTRDVGQFDAIARAHHEFFGDIQPSTTYMQVEGLAEEEMLVEIEVVAVTGRERATVLTDTRWEPLYGYSRAVRAGDQVHVSATAAWDPATGRIDGEADIGAQARRIFANLESALSRAGATPADVVHARIYTTDASPGAIAAIEAAQREAFAAASPAVLLVPVARMNEPSIRLEIEVDAIASP